MRTYDTINGYCPMGCGQTLVLDNDHNVVCSALSCTDPTGLMRILDDRETEHVVVFADGGFTVKHPLRERVGDALLDCELHQFIDGEEYVADGRYRFFMRDGVWCWKVL